jgi:cytidine deaminase
MNDRKDTTVDDETVERLLDAARTARQRAHAPYSGFLMGAAVLCDDGSIHPGALVESISLGLAMCPERVALFSAVANGAGRPIALALVSRRTAGEVTTPCGACLQVATEHAEDSMLIVCECLDGVRITHRLADLAPHLPRRARPQ